MNAFRQWLSLVACRFQWLLAIPPTRKQWAERTEAMCALDAAFQRKPDAQRETLH